MYCGYRIGGNDGVSISHLQFADDTLLLGEKSWADVCCMGAVFKIFKQVSKLRVNFHKSMLTGVNVSDSWLNEATTVMHC